MRIEVRVDQSRFSAGLADAQRRIRRGITNGLDRAGEIALQAKQRQVGKTYQRPTMGWTRSGAWSGGQRIERGALSRTIKTTGPAEKYEGRLANLPTGAGGINRTNKASEEAARISEPQIRAAVENAIANALRGL